MIADVDAEFTFAANTLDTNLARTHVPSVEEVATADDKQRKALKLPSANEQVRKIIQNGGEASRLCGTGTTFPRAMVFVR